MTRAEMGAPNWKLGLPMLPTVELSVYEHVIANMIDEARSQVIALPPTEIADRNGMKRELERFELALWAVKRELEQRV